MANINPDYRTPSEVSQAQAAQRQAKSVSEPKTAFEQALESTAPKSVADLEKALKDIESSGANPYEKMTSYHQLTDDIGKEIDRLLQSPPVDKEKLSQLLALRGKAIDGSNAAIDSFLKWTDQLSDMTPGPVPTMPRPPKSDKPFGMR